MSIITLTKHAQYIDQAARPEQGAGAPDGSIESYQGRGVFVPHGLTAHEIMEGAKVIERGCDVGHYTARRLAGEVLIAARSKAVAESNNLFSENNKAFG